MEWTADIELRRKGNGRLEVNRPDARDTAAIQDCITSSLQVKGRCHGTSGSLNDKSMALSSVAVAEPSTLMVMDQRTKDAPALRHKDATEEQLLEAARDGDERAFGELTGRCVAQVRLRIFRIVGNRQDADDALQESLLSAYIHLHQFRGASSFSSWLHRIAINSAVMLLRKRKVHAVISSDRHEDDDPSSWNAWDVSDLLPNPEQIYAKRQTLERLSHAVEQLPSSFRSVIDKFYKGECSIQETADAIGISVTATKSRLLRARLMLRSALKEQRLLVCELQSQSSDSRNASARAAARAVPR